MQDTHPYLVNGLAHSRLIAVFIQRLFELLQVLRLGCKSMIQDMDIVVDRDPNAHDALYHHNGIHLFASVVC